MLLIKIFLFVCFDFMNTVADEKWIKGMLLLHKIYLSLLHNFTSSLAFLLITTIPLYNFQLQNSYNHTYIHAYIFTYTIYAVW